MLAHAGIAGNILLSNLVPGLLGPALQPRDPCAKDDNTGLPVASYSPKTFTCSQRSGSLPLAELLWALAAVLLNFPALCGQVPDLQSELKAAATAEQSGHYEEAATLYQKLLSGIDSSKVNPSVLVHVRTRLATAYYLLHRYRESLEAVAPLTSKGSPYSPLPAQAWLVQGLDCVELGQLPEAIASLHQALELNPDSGTARLALGDALARSGRIAEAVKEYEDQTERTPALPDAWYKLGLAYAQLATKVGQDLAQKRPGEHRRTATQSAGIVRQGRYSGYGRDVICFTSPGA